LSQTYDLAHPQKIGVRGVVVDLSPLLKPRSVNPHATMITLNPYIFHAIRYSSLCVICYPERVEIIKRVLELPARRKALLDKYIPMPILVDTVKWITTWAGWRRRDARWLFYDPTDIWELYKDWLWFKAVADEANVVMKEPNTVMPV
jgi:hypothetical protein